LETHVAGVDHEEDGEQGGQETADGKDPEDGVHATSLLDVGEEFGDDETQAPAVAHGDGC